MNPEDLFPAEIRPHIIGVWRFRCTVGEPLWCCTFLYRGKFYDTTGKLTIKEAIDQAVRELRTAQRRSRRPKAA